jgi:hypothetical protein
MVLLATFRSSFQTLLPVIALSLLTQGFFCPGTDTFHIADVEITELSLAVMDTGGLEPGVRIRWVFPEAETEHLSYFSIYYRPHPDSDASLEKTPIPAHYRALLLKLPDSLGEAVTYGMKAVYVSSTNQTWESDSIQWTRLGFSPAVSISRPPKNSSDAGIKTVFELNSNNDVGETFRFLAFQKDNDSAWVSVDTTFPFNWTGRDFFPGGFITDSLQLMFFGRQKVEVKWCILATQSPGQNLTRLVQSLTCSHFFKERL